MKTTKKRNYRSDRPQTKTSGEKLNTPAIRYKLIQNKTLQSKA